MKAAIFQYGDVQVHYRLAGEGPLLVLLHGFGEDGQIWNRQVKALKGLRILVPDLPGTGQSGLLEDMSMGSLGACMEALVLSILPDHEKAVLIGHSMGGYIALAMAENQPSWLAGFGWVHSSAFADSEEKKQTRRKGIAFIRSHGPASFLENTIQNLYGPESREKNPAIMKEHLAVSRNFSADALVLYYEGMMGRPDRTEVLKNSQVPVLMIMGVYDTAVTIEDSLKQTHLPGLSYIHILRHSGHMGMVEEPGVVNKALENFIKTTLTGT